MIESLKAFGEDDGLCMLFKCWRDATEADHAKRLEWMKMVVELVQKTKYFSPRMVERALEMWMAELPSLTVDVPNAPQFVGEMLGALAPLWPSREERVALRKGLVDRLATQDSVVATRLDGELTAFVA